MISPDLLSLLACPRCEDRPGLLLKGETLVCPNCGAVYTVENGIPHLLPEDAKLPEKS